MNPKDRGDLILTKICQEQGEKIKQLKRALYRYGNHTEECDNDPQDRCMCGWDRARREFDLYRFIRDDREEREKEAQRLIREAETPRTAPGIAQ